MLKIMLPTPLTRLTEADDVNVSIYPGAEFWIEPSENTHFFLKLIASKENGLLFVRDDIL